MPDTLRQLNDRVKRVEKALDISVLGEMNLVTTLPVGSVYISLLNTCTLTGTWALLDSGNVLGGKVGKVYVWARTA